MTLDRANQLTGSHTPPPASPRTILASGCLILAFSVLAAFLPGITNGLVWDDLFLLSENTRFRGLGPEQVRWAFTTAWYGPYQPLPWLTYGADYLIWGMDPRGFHVTNVAFHLVNSLLFVAVSFRLLCICLPDSDRRAVALGALAAAAIFALHPMRVESVTWASARRDVMSGGFFLCSVWGYLTAVTRGRNGRLNLDWYLLSLGTFLLALLSKATVVSLPVMLLMLDIYPLRRAHLGAWKRTVLEKVPFLALSMAIGAVAVLGQKDAGAMTRMDDVTLLNRVTIACYGLMFYPRAMFLEWSWSPLYERPLHLIWWETRFLWSSISVMAITTVLLLWHRRLPALLLAWLSYGILLLPVSGLMQSGLQMVADRYSYLACMPLALIAGGGLALWWSSLRSATWSRIALGMIVTGYVVACGFFTVRQTQVWRSEETLWNHVLDRGPSALGLNNLAAHLGATGHPEAAIHHYVLSLRVIPQFELARTNLILNLAMAPPNVAHEALAEGAAALRDALKYAPGHFNGWYALGEVDQRIGDYRQMAEDFERVAALAPRASKAWLGLGKARNRLGQFDLAVESLQKAVAIKPKSTEAWIELAFAQAHAQQLDEARCSLQRAMELDPTATTAQRFLEIATGSPVSSPPPTNSKGGEE